MHPVRAATASMRDEMLYQAEQCVVIRGMCTRFPDFAAGRDYLQHVLETRWFASHWPRVARHGVTIRASSSVTGGAWWDGDDAVLVIPTWMATDFGVLHELAHICAPWTDQEMQHHEDWRRAEVGLVRRFMGPRAATSLRHGMLAYGLTL